MSDDEYDDEQPLDGKYDGDDQSLDDDLEESLNSPAANALERLEAREPPTDEDADLTGPILRQLANQERIPFLVVQDGFFLGFELSFRTDLLGYDYLRRTFQSATRTHRSDRYISALELDSGGAVGDGGLLYSGDREGNYDSPADDDGDDWETSNQRAGYEEAFTPKDRRLMIAEIKRLKGKPETPEIKKQLEFYKEFMDLHTRQGRIKSADPGGGKRSGKGSGRRLSMPTRTWSTKTRVLMSCGGWPPISESTSKVAGTTGIRVSKNFDFLSILTKPLVSA